MRKIVVLFIVLVCIFILNLSPVLAQDETSSPSASVDTTKPLDVFKLFWPVTAGRTIDDPLFFLKSLKENLRGSLIFGAPQKAEYILLLATKRVLEADKLMSQGKKDLGDKTVKLAQEKLNEANKLISENQDLGVIGIEIGNKLSNLEKYLNYQIDAKGYKQFEPILNQVKEIRKLIKV